MPTSVASKRRPRCWISRRLHRSTRWIGRRSSSWETRSPNRELWLSLPRTEPLCKCCYAAGMLWNGEAPDIMALEENMGAYCNILHGFLLFCHGSTVGAGPTLHASISASVKQVVECSIALLREAVCYHVS